MAIVRPFGEIVKMPFDVQHTELELNNLAKIILSLDGETRVVMESTGRYHEPVTKVLCKAGIFVSVVNAKLTHDYGGDTIRHAKTDKIDSLKIGNYALLDSVFPEINELFTSPARADGHVKWIDFVANFWHCDCVSSVSENVFREKYEKWCRKNSYNFSKAKSQEIHAFAKNATPVLPRGELTKTLINIAISQLNSVCESIGKLKCEMTKIAEKLPEYKTVLEMHGVGETLAPQLIAEIGDINNFHKRTSLACFAGVEPPENQSGKYEQKSRYISKQGSPHLRKALFQAMTCVLKLKRDDEPVFQFIDRKRSEGKPYKVYMIAACNKFLRIYYTRVKESLGLLEKAS